MSLKDLIKKAEDEFGLGGDYFKVQEGANKMRVLCEPEIYASEYQGKQTIKFVAWVIDRKDNKIKPYFMPKRVLDGIAALQEETDYSFTDFPMPFDITVNAEGAGTKEVKYNVIGARVNTPLTEDEKKALAEKGTIHDYLTGLYEKQGKEAPQEAEPEPEEDVPFPSDEEVPL